MDETTEGENHAGGMVQGVELLPSKARLRFNRKYCKGKKNQEGRRMRPALHNLGGEWPHGNAGLQLPGLLNF